LTVAFPFGLLRRMWLLHFHIQRFFVRTSLGNTVLMFLKGNSGAVT